MTGADSRYLCIHLGSDEFAIPLLLVKEVIGLPDMTPVPQAAAHFAGIMNLRGKIISVMDLRVKLGMKVQTGNETTVIILDIEGNSLGVVVDKVNSVQVLTPEMMSAKPVIDSARASDYVQGVFRRNDKIILILDVAKALQAGKAA